jgi:hypothetical protein
MAESEQRHPTRETPGADEMFCPECGQVTPRNGVICGHCGAPLEGGPGTPTPPAKWEEWGKTAAGFAYVLTPLLFAPVAFYCGHKLRRYDETEGMRIIGYALGSVVVWLLLVLYLF